jgi:hypothetical protein
MISKNITDLCEHYTEIENYEKAIADKTHVWHCHHRREIQENADGSISILTPKDLINTNTYYKREPDQLVFLTPKVHTDLHRKAYKKLHEFEDKQQRELQMNSMLDEIYEFYRRDCKPEEQYYRKQFLKAFIKKFKLHRDTAEHRLIIFEKHYDLLFIE